MRHRGPFRGEGAALKARTVRTVLITAAVVLYIGLGTVGVLFAGPAVFIGLHKEIPSGLDLKAAGVLWDATADDSRERRKLKVSMMLPALLLFVVLPALVAGLTARRRELHGSARWANAAEINKAGLLKGEPGILLGRYRDRWMTLPGQQSVLLSAPTRSGKGVGIVIPNLLTWPDSVVVVDIKGENYARTAGFRAKSGQQVFVWAPFDPQQRSHRWNPLAHVRTEPEHVVGDVLAISQVLYPSDGVQGDTSRFFNGQARNLFLGLAMLVIETPEWPRTISEMLRQSSGQGRPAKDHLQDVITKRHKAGRPLSGRCVEALSRFLSTSDGTLTSILATFNEPLTVFAEPLVDAVTAGSDFAMRDLRRNAMSVYVVIPPKRLADASVLLNLFFALAIALNTDERPEDAPNELKRQCLFVLDEMTAMGRISVLASAIGYLAGYNLRVLTVIQSLSQLERCYGKEDARTYRTNCAAQIMYAPREQADANEYSEALGTFTEKSESRGRSFSLSGKGGSSRSVNVSDQRRSLLLPQEFKELGTEREVVMLENCKPILADKIRYYADELLAPRECKAPVVPQIDLAAAQAVIEGRVRLAKPGETFTVADLAVDFSTLGPVPSPEDGDAMLAYVRKALGRLTEFDITGGAGVNQVCVAEVQS